MIKETVAIKALSFACLSVLFDFCFGNWLNISYKKSYNFYANHLFFVLSILYINLSA